MSSTLKGHFQKGFHTIDCMKCLFKLSGVKTLLQNIPVRLSIILYIMKVYLSSDAAFCNKLINTNMIVMV